LGTFLAPDAIFLFIDIVFAFCLPPLILTHFLSGLRLPYSLPAGIALLFFFLATFLPLQQVLIPGSTAVSAGASLPARMLPFPTSLYRSPPALHRPRTALRPASSINLAKPGDSSLRHVVLSSFTKASPPGHVPPLSLPPFGGPLEPVKNRYRIGTRFGVSSTIPFPLFPSYCMQPTPVSNDLPHTVVFFFRSTRQVGRDRMAFSRRPYSHQTHIFVF